MQTPDAKSQYITKDGSEYEDSKRQKVRAETIKAVRL